MSPRVRWGNRRRSCARRDDCSTSTPIRRRSTPRSRRIPRSGRSSARRPASACPGAADGFELAVRAILGQQVSVRAARTFAGRIVEASGTPLERPVDGVTHLFPTAGQLAESSLGSLGLTTARAATLQRVAELVAAGELDLSGATDHAATAGRLLAVPGIGPWTVAYVSMRALRDPDAFPVGDLGVRLGFEALGLPSAPAAMREHAERWRPWRAYAVMHLWNGGHRGRDGGCA